MIKIPPLVLPDGLSEQEYRRLSVLYILMGRTDLATQANDRLSPSIKFGDPQFNDLSVDEKFSLSADAGKDFALKLMKIAEDAKTDRAGLSEKLMAALEPLRGAVSDEVLDQLAKTAASSIGEAYDAPLPPRNVPKGLSAEEYFELGKKYRTCGWTELAREALKRAIDMDKEGITGTSALQYLRTTVPRYPVPLMAEQLNIQGFNLMESDPRAAKKIFLGLIEKYPEFEWPYSNVGHIYLRSGDLTPAEEHFADAIKINPHYANAWIGLGRINTLRSKFNEAKACMNKAAEIASAESVAGFISLIEQIQDWDSESTESS
ncbi:MAG: hypothetical protein JST89_00535 [Cyanobacteria bacterium SZAS-4]|nr:hypothetical protein [Cyanobacteria bacterium SZAS-4]